VGVTWAYLRHLSYAFFKELPLVRPVQLTV